MNSSRCLLIVLEKGSRMGFLIMYSAKCDKNDAAVEHFPCSGVIVVTPTAQVSYLSGAAWRVGGRALLQMLDASCASRFFRQSAHARLESIGCAVARRR